ncbi:hypothetical protein B0H66DRAFT_599158 [Apodospora peruviana]|uniref:Uncharacterized protein n=1 Tax=Apodospora peruviana TaxID=516989 RepID=A0AAE0IIJ0_9PEZI|nr:hypothetical protein B0H66DRAFT_599158 [Apodospora peruviana]
MVYASFILLTALAAAAMTGVMARGDAAIMAIGNQNCSMVGIDMSPGGFVLTGNVGCDECVSFKSKAITFLSETGKSQHNIFTFFSDPGCVGKVTASYYAKPGTNHKCRTITNSHDNKGNGGARSLVVNCAKDVLHQG